MFEATHSHQKLMASSSERHTSKWPSSSVMASSSERHHPGGRRMLATSQPASSSATELSTVRPAPANPQDPQPLDPQPLDPYQLHSACSLSLGASHPPDASRRRFRVVGSLQGDTTPPAASAALHRTNVVDVQLVEMSRPKPRRIEVQTPAELQGTSAHDLWATAELEAAQLSPLGFRPSTRPPTLLRRMCTETHSL